MTLLFSVSHCFQVFVDTVILCVFTVSRCLWTLSFSVSHSFQVFVDTVILCVAQFPGVCGHCVIVCLHCVTLFPVVVDETQDFTQAELDTVVVRVALSPGVSRHFQC